MATPQEKLAQSLSQLKEIQQNKGIEAIKSSELSRVDRERLLENGFIKRVIRGWYIPVPPEESRGDSTSWYANYWSFCSRYLNDRFNTSYCLSPEQSLLIHVGDWTVPKQLIVRAANPTVSKLPLLHNTSIYSVKSPLPEKAEIVTKRGLRILSLASSLIHISPSMFKTDPTEIRTALSIIKDPTDILRNLLEGGHTRIAGRIAGAFRNIGQGKWADEIVDTMRISDYKVREEDPFEDKAQIVLSQKVTSPYVNKIRLRWHEMRDVIINNFPNPPGMPTDKKKYMDHIENIYVTDAYHSLSIEKYRVTQELIKGVQSGEWDPENIEEDQRHRDAMAARGYWEANQLVRDSVKKVLTGENPGQIAKDDHGRWYRKLFAPSVAAGIVKPSDLAGYRNDQVYIAQSKHVPPNKEAVREIMPEFFKLLKKESNAGVRSILGHFFFVFTHPYMDGNGRMGRFLMNLMLASGGYPWTVIPVEERERYMQSLEEASINKDIVPFTKFVGWLVERGLEGNPVAKL